MPATKPDADSSTSKRPVPGASSKLKAKKANKRANAEKQDLLGQTRIALPQSWDPRDFSIEQAAEFIRTYSKLGTDRCLEFCVELKSFHNLGLDLKPRVAQQSVGSS